MSPRGDLPRDRSDAEIPRVPTRALADAYDVIIVGAGIAGCATAQALARADVTGERRILLFDAHPGISPRFSGEMIHPRGAEVLDTLGFYAPLVRAGAVAVEGFSVLETADDPEPIDLPYDSIPGARPTGVCAHHRTLTRVMREVVARQPQVDLRTSLRLVGLIREHDRIVGVELKDRDGRVHEVRAGTVIGADGKGSTARKLAGIEGEREVLGFTAGIEVVNPKVADPMRATVILGGPGPVLCYPIEHREDGSIVSRMTFDLPMDLPARGDELADYLLRAFVPYLPEGLAEQAAASILAQRDGGKLRMAPTVNLPAPRAAAPGMALVGDAAGCSHPITASGMTMGLLDAHHLGQEAELRADAPRGEAWLDDRSLRRYRAAHDRYVPTRQALADAIYDAFRGGGEGQRAIRKALFAYWAQHPRNRQRSLSLLSCSERRPHVFLGEYLRAARHAVERSLVPRHATHYPVRDRIRHVSGAMELASDKLGLVAQVAWAQVRPSWLTSLH